MKDQHLQERNDKKENLTIPDISEKEVSEDIQVLEPNEELTTQKKSMLKTTGNTSNPENHSMVMPEVDNVPKFVQERPPPLIQRCT